MVLLQERGRRYGKCIRVCPWSIHSPAILLNFGRASLGALVCLSFCKRVMLSIWSAKYHSKVYTIFSDTLLKADCAATAVLIKNKRLCTCFLVPRFMDGNSFSWGSIVGYFYWPLVHEDIKRCQYTTKRYGQHITAVIGETSKKWPNQLCETAIESRPGWAPV